MSSSAQLEDRLRAAILEKPDVVLDDPSVMEALVAANDRALGANVVDLRGIAMSRLEARLDRLEDTHRSVIAAAYENLAGTNQIHRAVLALLEPHDFKAFLSALDGPVSEALNIDALALVLESNEASEAQDVAKASGALRIVPAGFVEKYNSAGRSVPPPVVSLRQLYEGEPMIHGEQASWLRSEAVMMLDLGDGRLPAMLVFGSEDPHQFTPQHGTDLLTFFAGVFERTLRSWLS